MRRNRDNAGDQRTAGDTQLDLYRDDPARLALAYRTAAEIALHDPHWRPAEQRRRHDNYIAEAARIEASLS